MCNFLSLIVGRDNSLHGLFEAEYTDSHEDIIENNHLRDNGLTIARVEFTPPKDGDIGNLSRWTLKVDEDSTPDWFDAEKVRKLVEKQVRKHLIATDQELLIGGWWIAKNVSVKRLIGNLKLLVGGTVQSVESGGTVQSVWNGGTVQSVESGGTVQRVLDGGTVQRVWSGGKIISDFRAK